MRVGRQFSQIVDVHLSRVQRVAVVVVVVVVGDGATSERMLAMGGGMLGSEQTARDALPLAAQRRRVANGNLRPSRGMLPLNLKRMMNDDDDDNRGKEMEERVSLFGEPTKSVYEFTALDCLIYCMFF